MTCIDGAKKEDNKKWNQLKKYVKEHATTHDKDGNGNLSAAELQEGFDAFYVWTAEREHRKELNKAAQEAIDQCDTDGDNKLTQMEAITCLEQEHPFDQNMYDIIQNQW